VTVCLQMVRSGAHLLLNLRSIAGKRGSGSNHPIHWLGLDDPRRGSNRPRPCLDALQKLKFFHSLSMTSIFGPMHEVVNVGKKITNYIV
jgi:hypothetical protein